jgi:probable HAF family extracellular repeat protein
MAAFSLLVMSSAVKAQTRYTVTNLGQGVNPVAINNDGEIVGSKPNDSHAFLWKNGKFRDLGIPDAVAISNNGYIVGPYGAQDFLYWLSTGKIMTIPGNGADAVNDNGEVAGISNGPNHQFAFLYAQGKIKYLIFPGGNNSQAYSINKVGQVVGTSNNASGVQFALLYSNGRMQNIGSFTPLHINDHAQIVGWMNVNGNSHACLFESGHLTDIGILISKDETQANWINNSGVIVGHINTHDSGGIPFIYKEGKVLTIDAVPPPNFFVEDYLASNDAGWIIGYMENGMELGFGALLKPN